MSMQGPGYLAVAIQPSAQTDDQAFHDWYNTEHGPLRLRLPFILNGNRYAAADGAKPEWSAVYDVAELSWLETRIYTRLREERSAREKGVMGTFESLDRKIYSLVSARGGGSGASRPAPVQLAVSLRVREGDLEELDRWYEQEHIEMLSRVPGWLRSRRFRMVVGGIQGMPPQGQVECLAVHDFEAKNGLDGAEHHAAMDTPWRGQIMDKIISKERRQWKHHLELEPLDEPPSSVITTDGAHLRYQLEGNPADPILVFVNSILTNYHIWDDVTTHLLTTGLNGQTYRVLRYNARGYAQQDPAKSNPTRFDLLADDLEYLLQRLHIPTVHAVIGVSMGGVTSLTFALRHANKLAKFVACDCNVAASAANTSAWEERIELARTQGMRALADVTVKRWFTPGNHDSANAQKALEMAAEASLEGFVANTGALCNYDLKAELPGMQKPGLLIAGEADGKLPEVMQGFGIPRTSFHSIPRAGHLPMLENHEAFMEALAGFL